MERKCPAVLMLHDHGARFDIGKEKLVRPICSADSSVFASSRQWVDKYFDGIWFADRLCSQGYVVLVGDALYWGDRATADAIRWRELSFGPYSRTHKDEIKALKNKVYEGQKAVYDSLMSKGTVWAEQTLREDEEAVEFLAGLDFVDRSRIGAFGFSMGAHRCWLLAANSPLVKSGVAVCWMTSIPDAAERAPKNPSDYSMYIPSCRDRMDYPEIARMLAPKPMLFISGSEDRLFPKEDAGRAFSIMDDIYRNAGAEGSLQCIFIDGGHHCGTEAMKMVEKHIKLTL